jgi:hypothetical protein
MALNVGTATTQDQLIVYLHSYLLGIGALYEPRRFNRTPTSRTDDAAEWYWNAGPLLRSTTWRTYTTRPNHGCSSPVRLTLTHAGGFFREQVMIHIVRLYLPGMDIDKQSIGPAP